MSNEQNRFDYNAIVAADMAKAMVKPTLEQIVSDNLQHFEGFAQAGATLGLACEQVAGAVGCDPESLRRIFLAKQGKWAEFRARIQPSDDTVNTNQRAAEFPSDATAEASFARVW